MKKTQRERCANCGDWTVFGNAVGGREKLKWCGPCWRQREKYMRIDNKTGEQVWKDPTRLYGARGKKTP